LRQNPGPDPSHPDLSASLAAYGFSAKGDLLQQLLDPNREVAARVPVGTQRAGAGETATVPGLPSFHPDPVRLVSSDCLGATAAR
jgi:hypothetical protein